MKLYEYFISYNYTQNGTYGFGNCSYTLYNKITSIEQIRKIEYDLCSKGKLDICVIQNFQLLNIKQ